MAEIHGIARAARGVWKQIADAKLTIFHEEAISLLHASCKIVRRNENGLVRLLFDGSIEHDGFFGPPPGLLWAGKGEDEANFGIDLAQPQDADGSQGVEPQGAASPKVLDAKFDGYLNGIFQLYSDLWQRSCGQLAVSSEAAR